MKTIKLHPEKSCRTCQFINCRHVGGNRLDLTAYFIAYASLEPVCFTGGAAEITSNKSRCFITQHCCTEKHKNPFFGANIRWSGAILTTC